MHRDDQIFARRLDDVYRRFVVPAIWGERADLGITRWDVPPGEDGLVGEPVPPETALAATFSPCRVGDPWGPPWSTTWFRYRLVVPERLANRPLHARIDLGFDFNGPGFQAEGLIWDLSGDRPRPWRGLHPRNNVVPLTDGAPAGEVIELLVEAAANPSIFGPDPDPNSDRSTASPAPRFHVGQSIAGVLDPEGYGLQQDLHVLRGLLDVLPSDRPRRREVMAAVERCLDTLDLREIGPSLSAARAELATVLASPAAASAHRVMAIGHAHIDSAWLWPIRETRRKCVRTFSNVVQLAEAEPEFRFACSQAVQYEWVREQSPELFERMQDAARRGQWVPVGGAWVEADGNLPSGESLLRQMLVGQRYFEEHFGRRCSEVWIPDVFGYPASLPQIYLLCGAERFLTQKLSWNRTNRFPHHTFWWEGIDGSRVFTHFPPVETYNASMEPQELDFLERNFSDSGAATMSLMPFGFGDGGGGPTPEMMERFHRVRDLEGLPRVEIASPEAFFDAAVAEHSDAPVWVGELYLEMHRGTFTSQLRTKLGNRRAETALREAELWTVLASRVDADFSVPEQRLADIWRHVLLLQFHDILPGSSIGWVHREAEADYAALLGELHDMIEAAVAVAVDGAAVANPASVPVHEAVVLRARDDVPEEVAVVTAPPLAGGTRSAELGELLPVQTRFIRPKPLTFDTSVWTLDNGILSVELDAAGHVTSLVEVASGREVLPDVETGARWELFDDDPYEYDAWDVEAYDRRRAPLGDTTESVEVVADGPLVGRIEVRRTIGDSAITEVFELRAGAHRLDVHVELDWRERHRLLKVVWPIDVVTTEMVRDIQFGLTRTPIVENTSWDAARFEVCAHRFVAVEEPGWTVGLLNNGRYGHDVRRVAIAGHRPIARVRLTVAKGSVYPDPVADLGHHAFTYALTAGSGPMPLQRVLDEADRLNQPVRPVPASAGWTPNTTVAPWLSLGPGVSVSAVKTAADGSGDVIVRLHETSGARVQVPFTLAEPAESARLVNGLEDDSISGLGPELRGRDRHWLLTLRPFQIATLRLQLPAFQGRRSLRP